MSDIASRIGLVLLFILIAGIFVAFEIAIVSLRESQVQQLSHRGRRGQLLARLVANPTRFLAAVQVGITVTGFLSAALGAESLAPYLEPALIGWGLSDGAAHTIAFLAVTMSVAYVSLVLGELVPKRLAIQRAESISMIAAWPVEMLARVTRPVIALLTVSTNVVVRIFGGDPTLHREAMGAEELRDIVAAHEDLTEEERELIDEVFEAGNRELREVMVPRTDVVFIDGDTPIFKAAKFVSEQPHSRYPVTGESSDDVIGFIHIRDVLAPGMAERSLHVSELVRDVARFPGTKYVIPTLSEMRRLQVHMAVVEDEYGGTAGIVTMEDLVEEVVGDIRDEYDEQEVVDTRTVDGMTNLEDFAEEYGVILPEGPYETLAGYIVATLGRLPEVGLSVVVDGHVLVIDAVEGRRVARVRIASGISTGSEPLPE
jgi:putative hemolysin